MKSNKLNDVIASVAKKIENSEKLVTTTLAAKLNKIAEVNPHDQTVGSMALVLNKMSDNKTIFISKSDFRDLYKKFYTRNTKFADYMKDELGEIDQPSLPKYASKEELPISDTFNSVADPILSNALSSVFDKTQPLKAYSKEHAEKAKSVVKRDLESFNIKASNISIDNGNEYFILVKADFDTPKGITSVFVPVEISKNKVLDPHIFMANTGPKEINSSNIKNYLASNAGCKLKVNGSEIVRILTKQAAPDHYISDAEIALTKLNSSKESVGDIGSIIGLNVESKNRSSELVVPKLSESDSFANKLAESLALVNLKFGKEKVETGRDVINRFMNSFGFNNSQIKVIGADDKNIFYGVSIDDRKTSFKVPIKIENNKVMQPEIIICNGSISEFKKSNIQSLIVENQTDFKVAVAASPQYGLKPSDLIENVKKAAISGNIAMAEDALNVIKGSGDEKSYIIAFNEYINGLSADGSKQSTSSCNLVIKTASSQHPICGHTNLPLHKVYQDNNGNCLPLYRKNIDANYQGAFFMNSKIFG